MDAVSLFQFDTESPHEVAARLRPVAPPFEVRPTRAEFNARIRAAQLPDLGLFTVTIKHGNVLVRPMRGMYSINIPLKPGIDWRVGADFQETPPGSARVCMPEENLDLLFQTEAPMLVANISADFVHESLGDPGFARRARLEISLSTPEGAHLFRLLSVHWRDLASGDGAPPRDAGLHYLEHELVEAFAAAALPRTGRRPSSAEARRIVATAKGFIRDEIARPLTVAVIAEAARASTRTLHRAFLDDQGLSPMAYVKRERLNAVRRRLLAAEPAELTVGRAAQDCGFSHLGRFSVLYRDTFGESPSRTLGGSSWTRKPINQELL